MKQLYDQDFRLGILGGGQLGKMLIQSCADYNVKAIVLDQDESVPAASLAYALQKGSFKEYEDVKQLATQVDLLTIEIEHVNLEALREAERNGILVYPQPNVLEIIQDKGKQKQFYYEQGIPTSDFELIEHYQDIEQYRHLLPAFQKSRRAGYDGKGVRHIPTAAAIKQGFEVPSVLEQKVDFTKELSVIVARNPQGEMEAYPPVELSFHPDQNLVEFLSAPAEITPEIEQKAISIAKDTAEKLGVVGLLAVEQFLDEGGNIFVNEVAPRPHNSGHHTIEANQTSQYEQHLRAIFGLPLGSTDLITPAVMVNLLGNPEEYGQPYYAGLEEALAIKGVHPHIYGKPQTKPFRKMGHVTITDKNLDEAKQKARHIKDLLKVKAYDQS